MAREVQRGTSCIGIMGMSQITTPPSAPLSLHPCMLKNTPLAMTIETGGGAGVHAQEDERGICEEGIAGARSII